MITKSERIAAYNRTTRAWLYAYHARQGMPAKEIAAKFGVTIYAIYNALNKARQKPAKAPPHKRYEGTIIVHSRLCKSSGSLNPAPIVPVTALRAAGLEATPRLAFRVEPGRIILTAETSKE